MSDKTIHARRCWPIVLLAGLAVAGLSRQAMPAERPCQQIRKACANAGFEQGVAKQGNGSIDDCIEPIMQGRSKPGKASRPLPGIDPQVIAACRAANPNFGKGPGAGSLAADAPPQGYAGDGPRCGPNDAPLPSGLATVVAVGKHSDQSSALKALANPFIAGVAVQVDWQDIEPAEGQPDWSSLDELVAAAASSKKWVQFLIFPGFFAPSWALAGAQTDRFAIQYGPGKGTVATLPMPWDRVYLGRWFAFLKLLSERYGKSPAFRMIAAAGPTSVSAEMTLPGSQEDVAKWLKDAYTPEKYLEAWETVFRVYADYFPNQCISLSAPGIQILKPGKTGRAERKRAQQKMIDKAMSVLGRRLALQWSDLHAAAADEIPVWMIDHIGRAVTGLQMRTSAKRSSGDMGAAGDPPLALRRSIDVGMKVSRDGRHVDYLEIYAADVLSDEMQDVLKYGASLFARK